jgi:hypothetical protein
MKKFGFQYETHEILEQFNEEQREKWKFCFGNGYGASVIRRQDSQIYNIAVIGKNGCIDFESEVTCGKPDWICIGEISVRAMLNRISKLKRI